MHQFLYKHSTIQSSRVKLDVEGWTFSVLLHGRKKVNSNSSIKNTSHATITKIIHVYLQANHITIAFVFITKEAEIGIS